MQWTGWKILQRNFEKWGFGKYVFCLWSAVAHFISIYSSTRSPILVCKHKTSEHNMSGLDCHWLDRRKEPYHRKISYMNLLCHCCCEWTAFVLRRLQRERDDRLDKIIWLDSSRKPGGLMNECMNTHSSSLYSHSLVGCWTCLDTKVDNSDKAK